MNTTKQISHKSKKKFPKPTSRELKHAQKYQTWKQA